MLEAVLRGPEEGGEGVWADSAYRPVCRDSGTGRSEAQERRLSEGRQQGVSVHPGDGTGSWVA